MAQDTMRRRRTLRTAVACAAAAAVLAAGPALAAGALNGSRQIAAQQGVHAVNVAPLGTTQVMNIVKDGIHEYSLDGGATWTKELPAGFTLDGRGDLQRIK